MVGNFDVDVEQLQRVGHLLSPLPPEMRNDTAFMDRIHAYAPGWDFPKLKADEHLTDHFGLVTDYLSECWTKLREGTRISALQGRAHWGGALSGRDIEAVSKTVSGLLKLLFPDPDMPISDQELEGVLRIALEARRRVKEQQKRCLKTEFRNTHFSYFMGVEGVEQFVSTPGVAQRRSHRGRPAAARTSMGYKSWRAKRGSFALPHRSDERAGQWREDSQCTRAAGVP